MEFITHKVRVPSGEVVELRETLDGKWWACPVCGELHEDPPYDPNEGWPSHIECGCGVEFGDNDTPHDFLIRRWAELREAWLDKGGRTQRQMNQLKNIGENLPSPDEIPLVDSLVLAAACHHLPSVERLLNEARDIEERNSDGETALIKALQFSDVEMVRRLLAAGADANARDSKGFFCLYYCTRSSGADSEMIRLLIGAGADLEQQTEKGQTTLLLVTENGMRVFVRILVKAGADMEKAHPVLGGNTLTLACRWGDPDTIRLLIERGANVNARDKAGATPLIWLAGRDYVLDQHGLERFPSMGGGAGIVWPDVRRLTHDLVEAGAEVDDVTQSGSTALMLAARRRPAERPASMEYGLFNRIYNSRSDPEVVRALLECGADPTLRNKDGKTALDLAAESGATEVADILRRHGG